MVLIRNITNNKKIAIKNGQTAHKFNFYQSGRITKIPTSTISGLNTSCFKKLDKRFSGQDKHLQQASSTDVACSPISDVGDKNSVQLAAPASR